MVTGVERHNNQRINWRKKESGRKGLSQSPKTYDKRKAKKCKHIKAQGLPGMTEPASEGRQTSWQTGKGRHRGNAFAKAREVLKTSMEEN